MRPTAVPTRLLLAAALVLLSACGDADEENGTRTFVDCMEHIRADELSPPDCRRRASKICHELSRQLPFVTRVWLAVATAKGIASDVAQLAGIDFEPWNHRDCFVFHQDICHDLGPFFPCQYEPCLAEIPQECEEYQTR